jgi:hypothetical protein
VDGVTSDRCRVCDGDREADTGASLSSRCCIVRVRVGDVRCNCCLYLLRRLSSLLARLSGNDGKYELANDVSDPAKLYRLLSGDLGRFVCFGIAIDDDRAACGLSLL